MLAVIKAGGKQYVVKPGNKLRIEKIDAKEKNQIEFDQILLVEKSKKVTVGSPLVKGAKVTAKVLEQGKGKKLTVFKYKAKTRYKVKKGHRQPYTAIEIKEIKS